MRRRSPANDVAQVLAALRARRLQHTRDRIPAFLVIGPAGMGKSTLIQRFGLDCDEPVDLASSRWWLGEVAFFVEVAADPGKDGDHAVFGTLAALRPAIPVSGIVMVVSPADLTLADAGERSDMSAAQIRFLRDFEARFGYAPPLYVVVTKLDLTPGFAEFFDHLEPPEREQAWGFTLPVEIVRPIEDEARKTTGAAAAKGSSAAPTASVAAPHNVASCYHASFRRLLDAVRARVTQWISQEANVSQCERIVGFGAQLAALEMILKPMVEPLMPGDTRRWGGAFLRGLYFTSSQQDALAIDPLLPELSKRFSLQRTGMAPPDLGRDDEALGYFVEGLFRRVLLPEAGLVQRNNARSRGRTLRGAVAAAVVVIACTLLGVLCALSYRAGVADIATANAAAATAGPSFARAGAADLPGVVAGLDALAALRDPATPEPSLILPLDDYARALIAEAGTRLYDRAVSLSLAPLLNQRLARALVAGGGADEPLRAALAAADAGSDPGAYPRWVRGAGSAGLPPSVQAALPGQAAEAQRLGRVPRLDPAYAAHARAVLARDAAP